MPDPLNVREVIILLAKTVFKSVQARYARGCTVRGSSPGRGKRFVFFAERLRLLWGPPSLLFKGCLGYLPGKKRPVREVYRSTLSSAEVQNKWSYTSASPICLYGVGRENFIYFNKQM